MIDDAKKKTSKMGERESSKLVKDIRDRIQSSWEHDRDNRRDAATDLQFLANDQWPDRVRQNREENDRPMLTINRLPQFVRQITNDIRQADLSIKTTPVDEDTDPKKAKTFNGIIRQIQYRSSAHHVYSAAAEHQVSCGIGWFRLSTDYVDNDTFDQEIRIELIPNPLSVYCDPAAVLPDRSDASWIAVTESMPLETFKAKYPKAAVTEIDVPTENVENILFWTTEDTMRIAEYWVKTPIKQTLGLTEDGSVIDVTGFDEEQIQAMGVTQTREGQGHKIEQYIVSGTEILEGPNEWAGRYIPLIPVIGGEVPLETKTYRYGAIRYARDAQQLYNYNRTAAAEAIALQPKAPWLVTGKMVQKFKSYWDTANSTNRPYLPYDADDKAPSGPKREPPPMLPAAFVNEANLAAEDMKATTGIYDAGLGARSNETSGKAILARQNEGDVANFHFLDNLKRSLTYTGQQLIDLIPKVYDNARAMRIVGEDDSEEFIEINQVVYAENGMPVVINDLSVGRFDVKVTIGKSYSTKRLEAADSMLAFIQAIPESATVVGDLFAKSQDWPGADEIAKRLRNMVPPELLVDPDDEEQQQLPPPQPSPEEQQAQQMAAQGAEAEIAEIVAKVRKTNADAEQTEIENVQLQQMMGTSYE